MTRPRTQETPHPIDLYVGRMLRQARALRGISQQELGAQIEYPVTFQQVQKYERGFNRISMSRLWQFAKVLQLPISYFLPDNKNMPETEVISPQEVKMLDGFRMLPSDTQKALLALTQAIRKR